MNIKSPFNKIILSLILMVASLSSIGQYREQILLNSNWNFAYGYEVKKNVWQQVQIPHTWNKTDTRNGIDYYRGQATYQKQVEILSEWEGKRLFLKFDGCNTVANVFINGKHIGEHRGGYSSFIFELTNKVNYGETNEITVRVSNALHLDVMPLLGDFNFYGGVYRDVNLVITGKTCISPLDYASPGVYLSQKSVTKDRAELDAKVIISNRENTGSFEIQVKVLEEDKIILTKKAPVVFNNNMDTSIVLQGTIQKPHLWKGRKDPFLYEVVVNLTQNGKIIDQVKQPLGLRYYHVDKDKGLFLNGEHIQVKGICRHQDYSEFGNALHKVHHDKDMEIIMDMGANAIRLSHYPHAPYFYDLLDKNGIITWSEIPFVGPGGYRDKGFVNQESFCKNGKQQLKEMIRQNFNHPSILFWGLFNELKMGGDNPEEFVKELEELAKSEDPGRITTSASNIDGKLNEITELIAWNKYFGWYEGQPKDIGIWADEVHASHPEYKIGISEYGAGGSIYHHQEKTEKSNPGSYWHPEEWQAIYHEENWKAFDKRPYIWGTFIWNLFDFGASHRTEGEGPGINDKGLVTFDRKVKKDAWWFYKCNWDKETPAIYIANRRYTHRTSALTHVKVYSSLKKIELFLNGKSLGVKEGNYATSSWDNVKLEKGENRIEARSTNKKGEISDTCVWILEQIIEFK